MRVGRALTSLDGWRGVLRQTARPHLPPSVQRAGRSLFLWNEEILLAQDARSAHGGGSRARCANVTNYGIANNQLIVFAISERLPAETLKRLVDRTDPKQVDAPHAKFPGSIDRAESCSTVFFLIFLVARIAIKCV